MNKKDRMFTAAGLLLAAALIPREVFAMDDFPSTTPIETEQDRIMAFLWMIGAAETSQVAMQSGNAFRTFYGGSLFYNLSDHPVITGEKVGVRLPDHFCRAAGYGPGCVSTAAGALQIIKPTWERVRKAGSWGSYLPDFSSSSQFEAGRRLLIEARALDDVKAGRFDAALAKSSKIWASLPGSTAQQGGKSYADVLAFYHYGLELLA